MIIKFCNVKNHACWPQLSRHELKTQERKVMDVKISSKHYSFFSLFSPIITAINQAKPSQEIYQLCASLFPSSPSPGRCLVLEDAPNGVQAGLAAGMQVVMIPHNKVKKEYLIPATQVLPSMEHFRPQDFGLPPFEQ